MLILFAAAILSVELSSQVWATCSMLFAAKNICNNEVLGTLATFLACLSKFQITERVFDLR
jgi:hypothetical protein